MYRSNNIIPNNRPVMYPNNNFNKQDDRFLAPFLIGGIAGTALGYGIGNNNYYNRPVYYAPYPPYQYVPYNNNNYYYY